ncbi:hypothetical protein GQ44DRAFT_799690, partial [Phaeosphaeriaceae sp. PMI808]
MHHVLNVIDGPHRCVHDLLKCICLDQSVHRRIWDHFKPILMLSFKAALEHTQLLVDVERHGYPITLDHYFAQNIIKSRKQHLERSLMNMKAWRIGDDSRQPLLRVEDVLNSYASNEEQTTEELADILRSYHKVARKRFADNVCKQVIDHILVCSKQGPLQAFSAELVGKLSAEGLDRLVDEDSRIAVKRKRLQAEVEVLDQG